MKKFLIKTAVLASLVAMPWGLTACKDDSTKDYSMNSSRFYAMGLATGANYLNSTDTQGVSLSSINISNETKASLETYLDMFGGFMNNGIHPSKTNTSAKDGHYSSYQKKLTIKVGGEKYTLYYNETTVKSTTETDGDETETKTTKFLSGLAIAGVKSYYMVGGEEVETEVEDGKVEKESELTMILCDQMMEVRNNDLQTVDIPLEARYVKIEEEREDDEVEYKYTTSDDPTNPTIIEWENKKGKEELDLSFGTVEYEIKAVGDNRFQVVRILDGDRATFYIYKGENGCEYTTPDGEII